MSHSLKITRHRFSFALLVTFVSLTFAQPSPHIVFDQQGIQQLMPDLPEGTHLFLGRDDPNTSSSFAFDFKAKANPGQDNLLAYWRLTASPLRYASGTQGFSSRVHLLTSKNDHSFNWKNQNGFLTTPKDIRNLEFTVYVRVNDLATPKIAQVVLKIRGGSHHSSTPDNASCSMMTFAPATRNTSSRFGKELTHPIYDYVNLPARVSTTLEENRWVGLKLLSWNDPKHPNKVFNQLHVDDGGFDSDGRPVNHWRLLSEYVDIEGVNTGNYQKSVDWGSAQTTLRVDGYRMVDFAYPSLREIQVPQ